MHVETYVARIRIIQIYSQSSYTIPSTWLDRLNPDETAGYT